MNFMGAFNSTAACCKICNGPPLPTGQGQEADPPNARDPPADQSRPANYTSSAGGPNGQLNNPYTGWNPVPGKNRDGLPPSKTSRTDSSAKPSARVASRFSKPTVVSQPAGHPPVFPKARLSSVENQNPALLNKNGETAFKGARTIAARNWTSRFGPLALTPPTSNTFTTKRDASSAVQNESLSSSKTSNENKMAWLVLTPLPSRSKSPARDEARAIKATSQAVPAREQTESNGNWLTLLPPAPRTHSMNDETPSATNRASLLPAGSHTRYPGRLSAGSSWMTLTPPAPGPKIPANEEPNATSTQGKSFPTLDDLRNFSKSLETTEFISSPPASYTTPVKRQRLIMTTPTAPSVSAKSKVTDKKEDTESKPFMALLPTAPRPKAPESDEHSQIQGASYPAYAQGPKQDIQLKDNDYATYLPPSSTTRQEPKGHIAKEGNDYANKSGYMVPPATPMTTASPDTSTAMQAPLAPLSGMFMSQGNFESRAPRDPNAGAGHPAAQNTNAVYPAPHYPAPQYTNAAYHAPQYTNGAYSAHQYTNSVPPAAGYTNAGRPAGQYTNFGPPASRYTNAVPSAAQYTNAAYSVPRYANAARPAAQYTNAAEPAPQYSGAVHPAPRYTNAAEPVTMRPPNPTRMDHGYVGQRNPSVEPMGKEDDDDDCTIISEAQLEREPSLPPLPKAKARGRPTSKGRGGKARAPVAAKTQAQPGYVDLTLDEEEGPIDLTVDDDEEEEAVTTAKNTSKVLSYTPIPNTQQALNVLSEGIQELTHMDMKAEPETTKKRGRSPGSGMGPLAQANKRRRAELFRGFPK